MTSGRIREPRQARGPGSGGRSATAGGFYPAPALPSSFRGWVHAQAFSYLHPMGALQPQKGEEPVTVQAQQTSPCRGGGYHGVGVRASRPREQLQNTKRIRRRAGRSHSPVATLFRWRLHSHRDHKPDTNRRPRRAVFCPLSRVAGPLTPPPSPPLPLRPVGGEGTKTSWLSTPLPPPYRLGGLRPGPALLPTALFPHVGS